jgi:hypothetical protein
MHGQLAPRRIIACSLVQVYLTVAPLTAAVAQEQQLLPEPGARVRITCPELGIEKQQATLQALRGDSLVLVADSAMACPLASVTRLEAYAGQKSRVGKGALWGGVIGGVLGAFAGLTWANICESDNLCADCEWGVPVGFAAVGVAGALIGAAVGALEGPTERWEEIPLDQLRVSFVPGRDEFVLGVSIAF